MTVVFINLRIFLDINSRQARCVHNSHAKVPEAQHYFLYRFGNLMIPNLYSGKF